MTGIIFEEQNAKRPRQKSMSRAFFMQKALCEKLLRQWAIIKEETKKTQGNEKNAVIYLDFANFTDIYNFC